MAKWFIATPRGSVMLYCGFSTLISSLSDRNMRLGDVMLPPGIKQWCLYLRVQGLFTLHKVLLMQLSVALSLHFGWDSQLNTNEMFWIDMSRWMIHSRCRWRRRLSLILMKLQLISLLLILSLEASLFGLYLRNLLRLV